MNMITGSSGFCLLMVCFGSTLAAQENQVSQNAVSQIDDCAVEVDVSIPPQLTVWARGNAQAGVHARPQLIRIESPTPPADGIQEYRLLAMPATGSDATAGIEATDRWSTVARDAPWIRGVRILGKGDGIREVLLDEDDLLRIASCREFDGVSQRGSFDEALQNALGKMNAAMADSRAVDGMVTWQLGPVSGRMGGFAGFHDLTVIIYAVRTPPWR